MSSLVQQLLRDKWQAFEKINQPAGHQSLLDPLMIFGAQNLILLAPLLLLALWFAAARWSRDSSSSSAPERGNWASTRSGLANTGQYVRAMVLI